jgi:epoxyqueuosine reductase
MSYEEWDAWTRGSAIRRAGYAGFRRNVAVGLGDWLAGRVDLPEGAEAVLREALEDESELVREHAAWALGQVGSAEALAVLDDRLLVEGMETVREEIERALETGSSRRK